MNHIPLPKLLVFHIIMNDVKCRGVCLLIFPHFYDQGVALLTDNNLANCLK